MMAIFLQGTVKIKEKFRHVKIVEFVLPLALIILISS